MSLTQIWAKLNDVLELLDKIYHLIDNALDSRLDGTRSASDENRDN